LEMYEYRILKYIGAYTAVLGGADVIDLKVVVGQKQIIKNEKICKKLAYLGVTFNEEANKTRGEEVEISGADSKIHVVVIPTDEELMIAQDTAAIVGK
ncbi:MAG: acetate kinase, partial [Muribaculaceae bacterium]|nr:acetate kinase [Muribaculaceae bacterium]